MRRPLATTAFAVVLLGSAVVLFDPRPGDPLPFAYADKLVHGLTFAALAVTARWRFGGAGRVLAALVAYAVASELVQAVALDHRTGDARDLMADLAGALLGWWVAGRMAHRSPRT